MKTYHEANEVVKQITKPCEDCPFRRIAIAGWLAGQSPADYCQMAHSDDVIQCHTKLMDGEPVQCAGVAIYRANVAKRCELPNIKLPADRKSVFASPSEFLEYHSRKKLTAKQISKMMLQSFCKRMSEFMED